jgi:hypothetical protein
MLHQRRLAALPPPHLAKSNSRRAGGCGAVCCRVVASQDVSASHHVAHTQSKTMWYIWLATLVRAGPDRAVAALFAVVCRLPHSDPRGHSSGAPAPTAPSGRSTTSYFCDIASCCRSVAGSWRRVACKCCVACGSVCHVWWRALLHPRSRSCSRSSSPSAQPRRSRRASRTTSSRCGCCCKCSRCASAARCCCGRSVAGVVCRSVTAVVGAHDGILCSPVCCAVLCCAMLCCAVLCCRRTITQESLRSPLSVGFFIGCTLVMAMEMLELAVLSAGNLARFGGGEHGAAPPAEKAVTGFSVLLFLGYVSAAAHRSRSRIIRVVDRCSPPARSSPLMSSPMHYYHTCTHTRALAVNVLPRHDPPCCWCCRRIIVTHAADGLWCSLRPRRASFSSGRRCCPRHPWRPPTTRSRTSSATRRSHRR